MFRAWLCPCLFFVCLVCPFISTFRCNCGAAAYCVRLGRKGFRWLTLFTSTELALAALPRTTLFHNLRRTTACISTPCARPFRSGAFLGIHGRQQQLLFPRVEHKTTNNEQQKKMRMVCCRRTHVFLMGRICDRTALPRGVSYRQPGV